MLNITYQHALDNTRYVTNSGSGTVSATYRNSIPNQPWLFGNLDLGVGRNLSSLKDGRLQFTWSTQYTHWYYRSWKGFATANWLRRSNYSLHVAAFGGLFTKWLYFLASFIRATLPITGFLVWWGKRKKNKKRYKESITS